MEIFVTLPGLSYNILEPTKGNMYFLVAKQLSIVKPNNETKTSDRSEKATWKIKFSQPTTRTSSDWNSDNYESMEFQPFFSSSFFEGVRFLQESDFHFFSRWL